MSNQNLLQARQQLIAVKHQLDTTVDVSATGIDSQALTKSWQFRRASSEFADFVHNMPPELTVYARVGQQALRGYYLYQNQNMQTLEKRTSIAQPGAIVPLDTIEHIEPNSFDELYLGCTHIMVGCHALIASHSSLHVGESAQVRHDFIAQYKKIHSLKTEYKM